MYGGAIRGGALVKALETSAPITVNPSLAATAQKRHSPGISKECANVCPSVTVPL